MFCRVTLFYPNHTRLQSLFFKNIILCSVVWCANKRKLTLEDVDFVVRTASSFHCKETINRNVDFYYYDYYLVLGIQTVLLGSFLKLNTFQWKQNKHWIRSQVNPYISHHLNVAADFLPTVSFSPEPVLRLRQIRGHVFERKDFHYFTSLSLSGLEGVCGVRGWVANLAIFQFRCESSFSRK